MPSQIDRNLLNLEKTNITMQVKDLTTEQLAALIRHTVEQCLEEYFGDPDLGAQIRPEIQDQLKTSLAQTQAGARGIKLEAIDRLVNTN
jgi:hypothetical protein